MQPQSPSAPQQPNPAPQWGDGPTPPQPQPVAQPQQQQPEPLPTQPASQPASQPEPLLPSAPTFAPAPVAEPTQPPASPPPQPFGPDALLSSSQPEPAQVAQPMQPQAPAQPAYGQTLTTPVKKSHLGVIVAAIIGISAIAVIGVIVFLGLKFLNSGTTGTNNNANNSNNSVSADKVVAASGYDAREACTGAVVTNAAAYDSSAAVIPTYAYVRGDGGLGSDSFSFNSSFLSEQLRADYDKPDSVQLIACADRKGEGVQVDECAYEDDGITVKLKLLKAAYDVTVYEAKSGKKLGTSSVESRVTDCPMFVVYDKADPKHYLAPATAAINAAVLEIIK